MGTWKFTRAVIEDSRNHRTIRIKMPAGWWPINRMEWRPDIWDRPAAFVIERDLHSTVIGIHAWRDSGVYGYSGVWVFRVHGDKVTPINWPKGPLEYSDEGSFSLFSGGLRIWDFIFGRNEAHHDYHRYFINTFVVKGNRVIRVAHWTTKRRYIPTFLGYSGYDSDIVLKKDDPLREFNMRWTWWGPHAKAR